MREYRMSDILGTARESFADYSELRGVDNWERMELVPVVEGLRVVPTENSLKLVDGSDTAENEPPPPPVVALNAGSLLRR